MHKRLLSVLVLLVLMLQFSGCQFFNKPKPADDDASNDVSSTDDNTTNTADPLASTGPVPTISNYRPISVTAPDGLKLVGTLYVPGISPYTPPPPVVSDGGDTPATPDPAAPAASSDNPDAPSKPVVKTVPRAKIQYPVVVLLHMLSGDRWDWKEYPRHLVNAGYAVLALDMRGHGDSVYQGKNLVVWREFDKNDWQKMPDDIGVVLNDIAKKPEFNMVDTNQLALLGASIGANVAVNYASTHPKQVKALILLSPGLEYHGVETFDPMTHYENAVFFAASKEDAYAANSAQRLYKFALGKKKIKIYQDIGHGTDMMDNDPDLGKDILEWLKQIVPPQTANNKAEPTETETPPETEVVAPKVKTTPIVGHETHEKPKLVEKTKSTAPKTTTKTTATTPGKAAVKVPPESTSKSSAEQTAKTTPKPAVPAKTTPSAQTPPKTTAPIAKPVTASPATKPAVPTAPKPDTSDAKAIPTNMPIPTPPPPPTPVPATTTTPAQ